MTECLLSVWSVWSSNMFRSDAIRGWERMYREGTVPLNILKHIETIWSVIVQIQMDLYSLEFQNMIWIYLI